MSASPPAGRVEPARPHGPASRASALLGPLRRAGFLRGEGPLRDPVTLDRSRVFILPTGAGCTLAALLLVMLLGSVNYGNSLGLLLTFLLAGLAVVAMLHTHRNLAGLTLRPGAAEPVFAGDTAWFEVLLENPGSGRRAVCVRPRRPRARGVAADVAPGLTALPVPRPTVRRGTLALGPLVVETRFPVGFFRAWSVLEFAARCVVYPRPAPPDSGPPVGGSGRGESHGGGGQGDFSGLRGYRPGESLRTVHWKASARNDELLSKQFSGEQGTRLWLSWGDLPGLEAEERLSRLCRWALEAHGSGRPWGLRLPGAELGPARGEGHLRGCLAALAHWEP